MSRQNPPWAGTRYHKWMMKTVRRLAAYTYHCSRFQVLPCFDWLIVDVRHFRPARDHLFHTVFESNQNAWRKQTTDYKLRLLFTAAMNAAWPDRGLVVSASASMLVGLEFDSRPGLTKTLLIGSTAFLPGAPWGRAAETIRYWRQKQIQCNQTL